MQLNQLALAHFRSYDSKLIKFDYPTTIIVGPNAAGKTSIIEAIHLLASGDSLRATKIEQMIGFEQELARVKGKVQASDDEVTLEVILTRGEVQGKKVQKRIFSINDTRRAKRKFVGQLLTVVFRPEDMRLVEGSKRRRRDFMDIPLSLIDSEYLRAVNTYGKALTKRNRLLTQIREGLMPRETLTFWTLTVLKHGQIIQKKRQQFLDFFKSVDFPVPFSVEYDSSLMTEERMEKYAEREIAAGHTLIGPHKDDLIVKLAVETEASGEERRDIALYGSRGQQRMGVLWLKTCELSFLEHETQEKPLLLLDDVLSELDDSHQQLVLNLLDGNQTIITTASFETAQEIHQERAGSVIIKLDANS
ncbi:MAG: AAA family ATPase [Candidatus Pacebacteria bacterium]|jgi:DNA replication and repair protein RecF|nr:AAA family ATPase [Candidatus Paceibacterota bacterium]MBT3511884.1 AAA family ATPase [Candidatus Paceibacterota bacterium]MBT4005384.1 AAA family ATPase [Candidatus Paceibacterota bacterium]MBT4359300.1 AAA family ATPase [Candidatus Paceibacterota bacterium]MBT4681305.1 AAA family ATPase [Candidatus Paceibacterota bacterium]